MTDIVVEKTGEDAASKSLRVTVPVDRVRQAEHRALQYFSQRARLPGFRPGKAPVGVLRKRFGDQIRQTVLEEVIRESWETARSAEALKPIADPSIRNLKFEDGSPIEFELLVEVRPDLKLERVGGFRVQRTVSPVTDEAVDEQVQRLREQKAAWLPVEGAKPSPGQMVRLEVAPLEADGTAAAAQPYTVVLGEQQAIPELEERIMTMLPGQTLDTDVRFPDDHPDAARRGETRRVRVKLHEVKRQELPPLDDAFAGEIGEFDSLAGLRAAIRADLELEAAREADARVRQALLGQVIEANRIPAPDTLVHRVLHGLAHMYRVPEDQLPGFEAQFRPMAVSQVQRDLALDAVVEAHGLRATEAEIDDRVAAMAAARNLPPGELYTTLQKANRLGELERSVTEEKAFAFLLQQSTVDEAST
ncbi:MAG TPA: trigger factor [Gemmatimonadales bacterium]|nr:trigger factor [Gemmatimonadales bacterium]